MRKIKLLLILVVLTSSLFAQVTTTVWNPAANDSSTGLWNEVLNWTNGIPSDTSKVVFNVPGAQAAILDTMSTIHQLVMGDGANGDTLIITEGGELTTGAAWTAVAYNDTAVMVVESGGTVTFGQHLWVSLNEGGHGTVNIDGGTVNVTDMTGLGWIGGTGFVNVNSGLLNLGNLHETNSISDGSLMKIDKGIVVITGDKAAVVNDYITAGKIVASDENAELWVEFDAVANTTTVLAIPEKSGTTVWNPAGNPFSEGMWSNFLNWTDRHVPDSTHKVVFNVDGAHECVLDTTAYVKQIVPGDNGPGALRIAEGGHLRTGPNWSAIAYNDTATMVIDSGATVDFGQHLWVGFVDGAEGTLILDGGTVNVSNMTGLGWSGGKGFVHVNSGEFNLAEIDARNSIKEGSMLEIGDGIVTIMNNQVPIVEAYMEVGRIVAADENKEISVAYDSTSNKTTIEATLKQAATTVWNPGANPESTGLWSEKKNWSDHHVPDSNKVVFNVPDAQACVMDIEGYINQLVMGDGANGDTLRIIEGGNLTTGAAWSAVAYNDTAVMVVESEGEVTFGQHLWVSLNEGGHGTLILDGGTVNVTAMTGLGWTGGTGFVHVNSGLLNLGNLHETNSISDGSLLKIGMGIVAITGDKAAVVNDYIAAGKIVASDENAELWVEFDATANTTTVLAIPEKSTTTVWNPAGNPNSVGLWSNFINWTNRRVPDSTNKVVFNVDGAQECILNTEAYINQLVPGDNGPGAIHIAEGGHLTTGAVWSAIAYNDTATMVVDSGATVNFGQHLWVGFIEGAEGTLILNGGTVNVSNMTGLGWNGGTGFVHVNSGEFNLAEIDARNSIQEGSLLEIGDGIVTIMNNQTPIVQGYIDAERILPMDSTKTISVVYDSTANKTTIKAVIETAIDDDAQVAQVYELKQNYPNPFNPTTEIQFSLPKSVNVNLTVYNMMGQKVKTLVDKSMSVGNYRFEWNGTNDHGQRVATGVYFYQLHTKIGVKTRKMLFIK